MYKRACPFTQDFKAMLDGMLEAFVGMDDKLDRIQKSLDEYLETKRQAFPRFYFLSNDDLLEILGQSRDPMAVQRHVYKNFEGFAKMDVIPPGKQMNRNFECFGMVSPEGETQSTSAPISSSDATSSRRPPFAAAHRKLSFSRSSWLSLIHI